jgi:hypothetical protein
VDRRFAERTTAFAVTAPGAMSPRLTMTWVGEAFAFPTTATTSAVNFRIVPRLGRFSFNLDMSASLIAQPSRSTRLADLGCAVAREKTALLTFPWVT